MGSYYDKLRTQREGHDNYRNNEYRNHSWDKKQKHDRNHVPQGSPGLMESINEKLPCVRTGLMQPLCLTLIYNIATGALLSSSVDCGECTLETEFDYASKNLVIRVPFTGEGTLYFNDKFQASCVTTNITQP